MIAEVVGTTEESVTLMKKRIGLKPRAGAQRVLQDGLVEAKFGREFDIPRLSISRNVDEHWPEDHNRMLVDDGVFAWLKMAPEAVTVEFIDTNNGTIPNQLVPDKLF